jgi:hypothetical protein
MLVAFASRALIPLGFMPASDRPFSIEICWEDFPAAMLAHGEPSHADSLGIDSVSMGSMPPESMPAAHPKPGADLASHRGPLQGTHHHPGTPPHSEHCVFGTACSAGPILHLPLPSDISPVQRLRAVAFVSIAGAFRLVHLPQPRAPPGRLS